MPHFSLLLLLTTLLAGTRATPITSTPTNSSNGFTFQAVVPVSNIAAASVQQNWIQYNSSYPFPNRAAAECINIGMPSRDPAVVACSYDGNECTAPFTNMPQMITWNTWGDDSNQCYPFLDSACTQPAQLGEKPSDAPNTWPMGSNLDVDGMNVMYFQCWMGEAVGAAASS